MATQELLLLSKVMVKYVLHVLAELYSGQIQTTSMYTQVLSSRSHSSSGTYLGYNVPFISMFTKSDRECILGSKYYRILNRAHFFVCLFFTKQKGLI